MLVVPTPSDAAPDSGQDLRRAQILQAARLCFAEAGFHGASMHQICAAAKMSPGALYRYFPSKEAIIEAIAEEERAEAARVMVLFRQPGAIVDRIMAAALAYLRMMERPGSAPLMVEICAETSRNTAVGERFHGIELNVREELREGLEAAKAAGETAADLDVDLALKMLLAIGDGLALRMGLERDLTPEVIAPALRRAIVGVVHG